jgi:serine/threonine-protein phosphatase 2A regulatory subunit B''
MLDLVKPDEENKIRLKDLKRCKLTNVFFDTFFNLEKYLDNEQKDPFSNIRVNRVHISFFFN